MDGLLRLLDLVLPSGLDRFLDQVMANTNHLVNWAIFASVVCLSLLEAVATTRHRVHWSVKLTDWAICSLVVYAAWLWRQQADLLAAWLDRRAAASNAQSLPAPQLPYLGRLSYFQLQDHLVVGLKLLVILAVIVLVHTMVVVAIIELGLLRRKWRRFIRGHISTKADLLGP